MTGGRCPFVADLVAATSHRGPNILWLKERQSCRHSLAFVGFIFILNLDSFGSAFANWNVVTPEKPFVALDNYRNLVGNDDFHTALRNTICYFLVLYARPDRCRADPARRGATARSEVNVLRTAFYFPSISSSVVISSSCGSTRATARPAQPVHQVEFPDAEHALQPGRNPDGARRVRHPRRVALVAFSVAFIVADHKHERMDHGQGQMDGRLPRRAAEHPRRSLRAPRSTAPRGSRPFAM